MTKLDMVQEALNVLGDASPQALSLYVHDKHGIEIEPPIIAVIRATLWHQELRERFRQEAKEALQRASE